MTRFVFLPKPHWTRWHFDSAIADALKMVDHGLKTPELIDVDAWRARADSLRNERDAKFAPSEGAAA